MEQHGFSDEEIAATVLGEAPDDLAGAVRAAAQRDKAVRQRLERVAETLQALQRARAADALFAIDRDRLDRLAADTAPAPRVLAGVAEAARRLVALLAADSRREPHALAGFRASETERRLVFRADGVEIRLHITPRRAAIEGLSPGEVMVLGHVQGLDAAGAVFLSDARGDVAGTAIDADGFFELALAPGTHTLEIRGAALSVTIPDADLSA